MIAWFNIVNTKRIIDAAIEVTQHPERMKSLTTDAVAVGLSIKLIGQSKFGWDKNEIEKMRRITIEIINKKIDEIKSRKVL